MINFFRKIRQRTLTASPTDGPGRVGKYLLYAIGEIILVVIGILIALSVNNLNENRKQEAKVVEALKEIHRDLSQDIQETNASIASYMLEDSMIHVLMSKEMSVQDFTGQQGMQYATAALSYHDISINRNGFEKLMANSDQIPESYQDLVESLKKIYVEDQTDLDATLKMSKDELSQYLAYLSENTSWAHELLYNFNLTEDAIDYHLNDPHFKNHLAQYYGLSILNYYHQVYNFRIDAEHSYQELTSALQLEDLIDSDSTYYNVNTQDYKHLLGTFKDDRNSAIISIESDHLFYQWKEKEKVRLYPISERIFIHENDLSFNTITRDSTGQTTGHYWHIGTQIGTMKKVDL